MAVFFHHEKVRVEFIYIGKRKTENSDMNCGHGMNEFAAVRELIRESFAKVYFATFFPRTAAPAVIR